MAKRDEWVKWGALVLVTCLSFLTAHDTLAEKIDFLTVDGVIDPVVDRYLSRSLERALEEGVDCVVIQLDTPGGLMESMRSIVKQIMNSPIPIVVYVYPAGARAASAGVFIAMAADVAAMAPGTNIGAAHPLTMSGQKADSTMMEKITNDAVAFITGIAEQKGRNAKWAELAVTESASITARKAVELNVVDLLADDVEDLLTKLEGRKITKGDREFVLPSASAPVSRREMNFREKFLHAIANPNIAYILLLLGIYGLIYEFYTPGVGFPGVVGAISLIIAFFALQVLPINLAGLLLIITGIVLFILELKIISHGILTLGGIAALTFGSFMLLDTPGVAHYYHLSTILIIAVVLATTLFFLFAVTLGIKAQRRRPVTGREGIIGQIGVVKAKLNPKGLIHVAGEYWQAVSVDGAAIDEGKPVRVVELNHQLLKVESVEDQFTI